MPTLTSFVDLNEEEQLARGLLFTPREIAQQPATWQKTLQIFEEHQERIGNFLDQVGIRGPVEQRPVVMLVGAGTSDYIGHALALLLRKNWGCEVYACASTTLLMNLEDYIVPGRKYLWISFSRSGDSPEGVAVLQRAAAVYPEIAQLVVTCNAKARMIAAAAKAAHSCTIILDDAVNDRSLAMTSSFTNMIVTGQCLAHAWSLPEYATIQKRLVPAAEELLVTGAALAEKAAARGFSRVCLVGSGPLESVAKESGLKILEMTAGQITTMSETVLGLRHGPMAALNAQTLFVCFVPEDKKKAMYAKDLLTEIGGKQIVSERVAVGPASAKAEFASACDVYLAIHDGIEDLYRPILDVLFGQLLGLYCSVARGLKPDAPSPGGVISRVVQEFQIY
jgi:tagatose-6-phosphate ketose/aldose isomerase